LKKIQSDHWSSNHETEMRAASTSEDPPHWTAIVTVSPEKAKKFSSLRLNVTESLAATMKLFNNCVFVFVVNVVAAVSIATKDRFTWHLDRDDTVHEEIRTTVLFISCSVGATVDYQVFCGLTNISSKNFLTLTGSNGHSGVGWYQALLNLKDNLNCVLFPVIT
jgi:hypothetical protein